MNFTSSAGVMANRFYIVRAERGFPIEWRFEIAILNDWFSANQIHHKYEDYGFQRSARFMPPNGKEAEIIVSIISHERDVNAADWLNLSWIRSASQVLQRRDFLTPSGMMTDMLVLYVGEDRTSSIYRSMIIKDGHRMFRIEGRTAERVYEDLAEDIFISLSSFRILQPERSSTAEPLIDAKFNSPAKLWFQHLESWKVVPVTIDNRECLLTIVSNHEGMEVGRIMLNVRKRTPELNLFNLVKDYSKQLKKSGVYLTGARIIPIQAPTAFQAAAIYQPSARYGSHQFDAPLLLFKNKEVFVLLSLLGPSRDESPEWWAINKRAFEIVRDTLQVD